MFNQFMNILYIRNPLIRSLKSQVIISMSYFKNSFNYALRYTKTLHADKLTNIEEKILIFLCSVYVSVTNERKTDNVLVNILILSY